LHATISHFEGSMKRRLFPLILVVAVLLNCMGERVAGTSVGTDNPGLVVGFTQGQMPTPVTGTLRLYAREYNPLLDSTPFASFNLLAQDSFRVSAESLSAIWRKFSPTSEDSLLDLNLLITTQENEGAFVSGISFLRKDGSVVNREKGRRISAEVTSFIRYAGTLKVDENEHNNYLIIFGTPFFARVGGGSFVFQDLPQGRYNLSWIPFNKKIPVSGTSVDVPVYDVGDSLNTGTVSGFMPGEVQDTLVFPTRAIPPVP
jgi:hypothetical protein